jgi:N4-gp56 family major capsid protein
MFRQHSVFLGLVPFAFNLGAVNTTRMTITQSLGIHPNFDSFGLRDIWMPASHIDSRSVDVVFQRNAGKVAYDEYSDLITYWQEGTAAQRAGVLESILRSELGMHYVEVQDYLIRNAFLSGNYKMYAGGATDFATLGTDDVFDLDIIGDIWLGLTMRDAPIAADPNLPMSNSGSLLAITSPGVINTVVTSALEDQWKQVQLYAANGRLNKYEVGAYQNARFMSSNRMVLFNCGAIIAQAALSGTHPAGSGAPDPSTTLVDGVYKVGQDGMQRYIQLGAFGTGDINDFEVNDIVSIHVDRTSDFGVTNGADYRDGTKHDRRVVAIDTDEDRLYLDRPIMEDFGNNVGYVTKARHIHATVFVGGPKGVVAGVGRPVRFKALPPVDDFGMVHRFSWDQYIGYQQFRPEMFEVYFSAGPIRIKGNKVTQ